MSKTKIHFYQAFDATVKKFNLDINEIAMASGVPVPRLLLFKGGFDTKIDIVEDIIAVLPTEAKSYFMKLVVDANMETRLNRRGNLWAV